MGMDDAVLDGSYGFGGKFRLHVCHTREMVMKGHHICVSAKGKRVRRMEDVVVALAEDLCKRVGTGVPDFFPVIFARCTHVVLMANAQAQQRRGTGEVYVLETYWPPPSAAAPGSVSCHTSQKPSPSAMNRHPGGRARSGRTKAQYPARCSTHSGW